MDGVVFDDLSSLNMLQNNWRVKVRVTRIWPTVDRDGVLIGYNFILLDNQNYQVHAFVKACLWSTFRNDMDEGNIYEICNLHVREAFGRFRTVNSPMCIIFSSQTIVHRIHNDDSSIAAYKFNLIQLSEIVENAHEYNSNQTFATDTIGVVENVQPIEIAKTMYGMRPLIKFKLGDGRQSVCVHLWDDITEDVKPLYEDMLETPIIIVLASVKVHLYKGQINITNIPGSKVYINPNLQEVFNLRHRLDADGYVQPQNV